MAFSVQDRPIEKILVLRFSSLGDIVMTLPTLRALRKRFPNAQIDMVVRKDFLDIVKRNPHLDARLTLARGSGIRGLIQLLRDINKTKYDLVYDCHRSLRTLFLMPLIQAPYKAYFRKHYLSRNLSLLFKFRWLDSRRFIEKFIDPLRPYGVYFDGQGPEIPVDPVLVQGLTNKFSISRTVSWIGIIPSAQWEGKRWPTHRFGELCHRITQQTNLNLMIFGGPADSFCSEIAKAVEPSRVINLQGKVTIEEAYHLLSATKVVVANDTGLMHLADAVGVPSVVIFGPTHVDLGCEPFNPLSQRVEKEMWCRPCSKNGQAPCIRGSRPCLTSITSEDVWEKLKRLL